MVADAASRTWRRTRLPSWVAVAASATRMEKGHRLFFWSWFGVIFLFFSASTGKRGVYLLPLHPAAAILVGWFCHRALEDFTWDRGETYRRWLRYGCAVIGATFGLLGIALLSPLPARAGLPPEARGITLGLGVLALACGAAAALLPPRRGLAVIAAGTALLALLGVVLLGPIENRRQNITGFSAVIAQKVPEGAHLGIVRDRFEDLVYYSHREGEVELRPGHRIVEWLSRPETVYAVMDREALDDLKTHAGLVWELLDQQVLAGKDYYLIVKR